MTYHNPNLRLGLTAIAAVLALSSTPLSAQDSASPPVSDPTSEPAAPEAPAADPLAPEPAPAETSASSETSSAAVAKPAAKPVPAARRAAAAPRPAARTAARAEPAQAAVTAPTPVAPAAMAAPSTAAPVAAVEPAPPGAEQPTQSASAIDMDQALPIAGAGALGLMLLGGAAAVRKRRRRKQEEADEAAKWAVIEASAQPDPPAAQEPAFTRPAAPRHDPVPGRSTAAPSTAATTLPNGFDLSRFGRHVQAAYRGPTPDNPSLSLRHRLRRASFFDQQERRAAEQAPSVPASSPARPSREPQSHAEFMFRRAGTQGAEPALQD